MKRFKPLLFIVLPSTAFFFFYLFWSDILIESKLHIWSKKSSNVVKIIHQSWKTNDVPNSFRNYSKSWTNYCFPGWKYMFWTDQDNYNLIKTHYPWFIKKYNSLPANIYRADVSRYFYLFHYGGIYTDMDNECLKPFEHLLSNYSLVFGAMIGQYRGTSLQEGYVQNSFMYSRSKHEFWLRVIFEILNFSDSKSGPEDYTGPVLLSKVIDSYRHSENVNDTKIYPPHFFNPLSWLIVQTLSANCKDYFGRRMTQDQMDKCRLSVIQNGSFVIQYHAHTWG